MDKNVSREHFDRLYKECEELIGQNSDLECISSDENFLAQLWVGQIFRIETAKRLANEGKLEMAVDKIQDCISLMNEIADEYSRIKAITL